MKKIQFSPNGVSFKQIKQDAKRLSKSTDLTYQQALNKVVSEYTEFQTWELLNKHCTEFGGSILKYSYNGNQDVVFANKPIVFISNETLNINKIIKNIKTPMKPTVIFREHGIEQLENIKESLDGLHDLEGAIKRSDYVLYKESLFKSLDFEEFDRIIELCKKHKKALFFINNSYGINSRNLAVYMKHTHRILDPIKQNPNLNENDVFFLNSTWSSINVYQAIGRRKRNKHPLNVYDIINKDKL